MRGSLFAFLGGACITLQGVTNSRISQDIGTWQSATITQLTGFIMALLILIFVRDGKWQRFKQVKPLYLTGGALGARGSTTSRNERLSASSEIRRGERS